MAGHAANSSFTCNSINGCFVAPANGTGTGVFTLAVASGISGGARLLDTAGGAPSTYTQYDTDEPLGPAFFVAQDGGFTNIQTSASRDVSDPQLAVTNDPENIGTGAEGRVLYSSQDGGATLVFVGFIDGSTSDNGNNLRIRTTQVEGGNDLTTAVRDAIDARVPVGSEVWVGDVGDDGTSTTFSTGFISRTTATTFTLHGAATAHIDFNDVVTSVTKYSTTRVNI